MYFLWYLLIGLVAGWLDNLLVKGHGSGLVVNLIVGIVGGILGGWILSLLGLVAVGTNRIPKNTDFSATDRNILDFFA